MPAQSPKQQRYMAMLAHDPSKRASTGISEKVAEEFSHKPAGGYSKPKKSVSHMARELKSLGN